MNVKKIKMMISSQGSQHSGKTWEIRGKSGKVKNHGIFLENQSTQGKVRETFYISFQLVDTITIFGS